MQTKGKILIVDDSITQATTIKFALVKAGFDVCVAKDGIDGIAKAYENFPDIIISDIIMPEINGYQLCRVLKNDNLTRRIPIILLTSLDEKIDRFWGIKAGADSFFVKTENVSKLVEEIKKFLSSVSLLSETERKHLVEKKKIESTSIKSRVSQLLDHSLIQSTITNEFRILSELIHDRISLTKGLFFLLFSILDYQVAGIYFNDQDTDKSTLSLSLSQVSDNEDLLNKIRDEFFQAVHPEIFSQQSISKFDVENFETHKSESKITINNINSFSSKIIIPIKYGSQILGGICFYNTSYNHYKEDYLIRLVCEELVLLMRLRSLYIETKILAITDSLTKLYNRRYFQDVFDREFNRAKRYSLQLSIVMIDIDHFKNLNDTFGHQAGDQMIAKIAELSKINYRKTDCVARYGGEEIIIVLPETSAEKALIPTSRLKDNIENTFIEWDNNLLIKATVSIGIAEYNQNVQKGYDLIKQADDAMYNAKKNGRNRIEIYSE